MVVQLFGPLQDPCVSVLTLPGDQEVITVSKMAGADGVKGGRRTG